MSQTDYDVPRKPGFYWVVWRMEANPEMEPARFDVELFEPSPSANWDAYLSKDWAMLGTDDPYPCPELVLGPCTYQSDDAWGIYKAAARFAQTLQPGNKLEITGDYCELTLRNPSPAQLKRRKKRKA